MTNPFPALLVGGPPHAGKSVLMYNISQALRLRHIRHYAIRACPDGEGNWSQESDRATAEYLRKCNKGYWSDEFVRRMGQALEQRRLPFLVDMGSRPREAQLCLFRQCTRSLLLVRLFSAKSCKLGVQIVE